jgi:hypothetical protein
MDWHTLDRIADAVNPLMGVAIAVLAVVLGIRHGWRAALRPVCGLLGGLVVVYGFKAIDGTWVVMARFGSDYSAHAAVHLAAWVALLCVRPRLFWLALSVCSGYFALMLWQGYHTPGHLLFTSLVVAPGLWVVWQFTRLQPERGKIAE